MHTLRRLLSLVVLLPSAVAHAATYIVPSDDVLVGKAHAIVIARALTSYAEDSKEHGIETVTVLSVEDVLKGAWTRGDEIEVRTIGGVLETRVKVVPGAPRFTDGERVLVFLNEFEASNVVTDFALGLFRFETDDTGREVLIREATEIHGWNTDGSVHHEARRDAGLFLTYVRGIARHLPAKGEYTVEPRPLVGDAPRKSRGLLPLISNVCSPCTVTQYTMSSAANETDDGMRWNVFPGAANYNKGNNASNATNNGTDAITGAFSNWNSDAMSNTNLVLATFTANTNGITDAADGVSNVSFEKDLPGNDFSCMGGGLLGLGGIQATSGASTVNGEDFFNVTEADATMNQGVNACIPGSLSQANFTAAVTHEVGHTLGFRHSNENRNVFAPPVACTTQPTYDCSNDAIMTAVVTYGALKTWDISAVRAVYPGGAPPAAPTGVVATATSTSSITVTWTPVGGATSYEVDRRAPGGAFTLVGSPGAPPFNNNTGLSADTAYLYRVRAVNGGGTSANSASDLATTIMFTDDPFAVGTTLVKATHLSQLRTAVTTVRAQALVGAPAFTDSASAGVTIKAVHITELRTQLDAAMSVLGLTTGGYTDGALGGVTVKAVHFQQLANRVK